MEQQLSSMQRQPSLSYLCPSTALVNVASFISAKLQWFPDTMDANYVTWKKQMMCLMESQGLMGYIDGSISPPLKSSQDYNIWRRNDALVMGWILGSLCDQIASIVITKDSAKGVWSQLEEEFGCPSLPRIEPLPTLAYPSPSVASVNVANFVSTKLQWLPGANTNYEIWKKQMLCLIVSQRLMEYIDGSIALPLWLNQDYDIWKVNNALVMGWILGALSDEITSIMVRWDSAKDIWFELEQKFGQSQMPTPIEQNKSVNESSPLHTAVLEGNWGAAKQIFTNDQEAKKNWIDGHERLKPLHIAVGTGKKAVGLVRNMIEVLDKDDLVNLRDIADSTALHTAAAVGNKDAAAFLVEREPKLCYIQNKSGRIPIHVAARYRQREVLEYLIEHTKYQNWLNPYTGYEGQQLLTFLIQAEFFDIALRLAEDFPHMLRIADLTTDSPLTLLTTKKHALSARNFRENFVSSWLLPLATTPKSHLTSNTADVEGMTNHTTHKSSVRYPDFECLLRKCIDFLVTGLREKIKKDRQAQQLLQCMCKEIGSQDFSQAAQAFHEAILVAAEFDVQEVVVAITKTFPGAIYSIARPSGQHIFHKAIESRSMNVFNLIYGMSDHKSFFTFYYEDNYGNNPLHSAGKLAPSHKLNKIPGAALQMQREIQWFKEVEKIVHPYSREQKNSAGKTPNMVFTEEHHLLKELGEKWMRNTASSFTLVAILIATVMFTGAVTVPGGNDEKLGFPVFEKQLAFTIFAISDAISLFTSTASLLWFLAILTSRYAEEDFLHSLPRKLMYGTATLILSIVSMMVSFVATIYLVFGHKKFWVLFPLISACLPVAAFVPYQSVLYELYSSTYGDGIFGKKSKNRFY